MIAAFNVAIPSDGTVVTLEDESQEGHTFGSDTFPSEGGYVIISNSGTVNCLVGGSDGNAVFPVQTTNLVDEPLRLELGPNDKVTARVTNTGTAGQLSVIKVTR